MQGFKNEISITRFFTCIFLIAAGSALFIVGCILIVDPYTIWRPQATGRFNASKLEIPSASQPGAAILRSAVHPPDVLILGSSRVRRGFNERLASRLYGGNVQVSGVDALPLSSAKNLFSSISQHAHVKKLYLEVNYLSSNACEIKSADWPAKNSFTSTIPYFSPRDALIQSLITLKINLFGLRSFDNYFDMQGRYHDSPSERAARAASAQTQVPHSNNLFQTIASACQVNAGNTDDIKDLTGILQMAQSRQTEIVLLVLPVSASWQTRIRQAGLLPPAVKWKRDINRLASRFQVSVLDYEQRDDLSVLAENSSYAMPIFWDDIHFSNRLGDRILSDMHNASQNATPQPH